ncbi:unnamed protein product [Malus baccata var. baccata]
MCMGLSAKNKIGFIDGTIKAPPLLDTKYTTWKRCNDMVTLWIVNSIYSDIASSIMYIETAVVVWNNLKDRFSQSSDSRIYQIRQEIVENCQEQLSVSAYYTKMKALWDELASYHDPLVCTCAGLKGLAEREEKERVMQFLMGLNDSYSTVQQASASQLNNNKHFNTSSCKSLKCTYCDGDGHLVDRCYYIIGFPVGHKWHGRNMKPKNKRTAANNAEIIAFAFTNNSTESVGPMFTAEEYNKIIAMLRNGHGHEEGDWPGQAF